jgi:hypothetical protein
VHYKKIFSFERNRRGKAPAEMKLIKKREFSDYSK